MKMVLLAVVLMPLIAMPDEQKIGNTIWSFKVENGTARVEGASPASGMLEIPSDLGGCPVKTIGMFAFDGCDGLTAVTIPQGVAYIGSGAFFKCCGLTSLKISPSVTHIYSEAFENCEGLSDIRFSQGLQVIGPHVFSCCKNLKSVCIPKGVKEIDRYAFANCSRLKTVTIPSSVEFVGEGAFDHCLSLETIYVEEGDRRRIVNLLAANNGIGSIASPEIIENTCLNTCGCLDGDADDGKSGWVGKVMKDAVAFVKFLIIAYLLVAGIKAVRAKFWG